MKLALVASQVYAIAPFRFINHDFVRLPELSCQYCQSCAPFSFAPSKSDSLPYMLININEFQRTMICVEILPSDDNMSRLPNRNLEDYQPYSCSHDCLNSESEALKKTNWSPHQRLLGLRLCILIMTKRFFFIRILQ